MACLGYFVKSLIVTKGMILRFWFAEWRIDFPPGILNHILVCKNCRSYGEAAAMGKG